MYFIISKDLLKSFILTDFLKSTLPKIPQQLFTYFNDNLNVIMMYNNTKKENNTLLKAENILKFIKVLIELYKDVCFF